MAFWFYESRFKPMYVGQSVNIEQRWRGHNIPPLIHSDMPDNTGITRWFLRMDKDRLKNAERFLIAQLHPPYNIIGRTRGVS